MNQYLYVLGLAALPALGNFSGGVIAAFSNVSNRMLHLQIREQELA